MGLRYGFGVDTQTVAGTDPGYAFFPSNSPTIERQEPDFDSLSPEAGREFVTAKYGLNMVLDTWEGVYASLLRIGHRIHQERASPNS